MLRYLLSKLSRRAFEEGYKYGHLTASNAIKREEPTANKKLNQCNRSKSHLEQTVAKQDKEIKRLTALLPKKEPIDYPETDLPLSKPKVKKLLTKHERRRRHEDMLAHAQRKKLRKKLMGEIGFCIYCGLEADTLDHLVPKSRGGTNEESNLALSCLPCNQLKGALTYEEFMKTKA